MKSPLAVLLAASLLLLSAVPAQARDSVCLLGDDGKIAVSTFEHRAGGSNRATDVTLIFGGHILRGLLKDVNSGPIAMKEFGSGPNGYSFSGTISVDYPTRRITLKGKLQTPPDKGGIDLDASFEGKELQP